MTQNPAGFSLKSLEHYEQLLRSKTRFHQFDYGKQGNRLHYNSDIAPDYPVDKINVPIHMVCASEDYSVFPEVLSYLNYLCLSEKNLFYYWCFQDAKEFFYRLPEVARKYGIREIQGFNHVDLVYGKDVAKAVYHPIVDFLDNAIYNN